MKKSDISSGIAVKLGSHVDGFKSAISKGIKLQEISPADRARLRIPTYEYILP